MVRELEAQGWRVVAVPAPRLSSSAADRDALLAESPGHEAHTAYLQERLHGSDVVVVAAGMAAPDAAWAPSLIGANALLPVLVARAASRAGCGGVVHISSAAVQGRVPVLDETEVRAPFSPYSTAKALGEDGFLETARVLGLRACAFRATSVHGRGRPATSTLRRVARSPLASVAAPGTASTPLVSVSGLARAVAYLLPRLEDAPAVVLQPDEGATTRSVLIAAGGREPRALPASLARAAVVVGYGVLGRVLPRTKGIVRRVELMWFGQAQARGWLSSAGYAPRDDVHRELEDDAEASP